MDIIKDNIIVYQYDTSWNGTDMIKFYTTSNSLIECLPNFLALNNLEIWL
jgi:hypothetical protein